MVSAHDGACRLVVSDNGKGFPEDEIEHVFEKFYRVQDSRPGGTGLGLSIARGFTQAMGGTIQLQNIPDGGARCTIDIPAESSSLNELKQ